jgi:hypothetical protein
MPSHPYISGPGNITQMIGHLRRNFPASVTSETVKKFGLASNNESYVINALQFVAVIDSDGKRIERAHDIFLKSDNEFEDGFSELVREAYKDLFDTRGEQAWTLSKTELTSYFRAADKTSEIIAGRQASVFQVFAGIAGQSESSQSGPRPTGSKLKSGKSTPKAKKSITPEDPAASPEANKMKINPENAKRDLAMTVRIEINLPSSATQDTYDMIFKSIRNNLINE